MAEPNTSGYTPRVTTPPKNQTGDPSSSTTPQAYPQNAPQTSGYPPQPPTQPPSPQTYPQTAYPPTQPVSSSYPQNPYAYQTPFVSQDAPNSAPQSGQTTPSPAKPPFWKQVARVMRKRWYVFVGVLVLAGITGVTAFWLLSQRDTSAPTDYVNVETSVQGPAELNTGVPAIWTIRITNQEAVALENVTLNLTFDRAFTFQSSLTQTPENLEGTRYDLGSLGGVNGGSNEKVVQVQGTLVGRIGENTLLQGTLTYMPAPFAANPMGNEVSLALEPFRTRIEQALVELSLLASEARVQNGNEVTLNLNFENLSDQPIDNVRLEFTYPDRGGFEYLRSSLQLSTTNQTQEIPDDGNNVWRIASLPRFERQNLQVTGILQGADGVRQDFKAALFARDSNGEEFLLRETSSEVIVTAQPLLISTALRGKSDNSTFAPGESLTFEVEYQNQSTRTLRNVEVLASLEDPGGLLDYSTLAYAGGDVADVNNQTIQWTANGVPALETVPPRSTGRLSYTIEVISEEEGFIQTQLPAARYVLTPRAEAKALNQQPIQTQGPTYKAEGELSFTQNVEEIPARSENAAARRFRVTWSLFARQNEVRDVVLETRSNLPPEVWQPNSVQPNASAGELTYNPNNGRIEWRPGVVRAYTGVEGNPKTISFEMEIERQGGQNLYESLDITGVDDVTGVPYRINSQAGRIR